MDTESNQKARRFTKLAWCEKRRENPRKKVASRSQKAGQAGAASKTSPDVRQAKKVNPDFGVWAFIAALIVVVFLMGIR